MADGQPGELVVTNLGRTASPVIRYRTGDIVVRRSTPCACGRTWARLEGGILARADDMVEHPRRQRLSGGIEVGRAAVSPRSSSSGRPCRRRGAMRSLSVEIELGAAAGDGAGDRRAACRSELREALGLTVPVHVVDAGTLPRFEMKARRFVVEA